MTDRREPAPLIVGASVGDCVHVAGVRKFLDLARSEGYRTHFMGPAVPLDRLLDEAADRGADIVAVSYRLTPEAACRLLARLEEEVSRRGLADLRFVLGGTAPVCRAAEETGLFEAVFSGSSTPQDALAYLRGEDLEAVEETRAQTLVERIGQSYPRPLIRHHYGQPTVEETARGMRKLADSRLLDIISIGPDQNAQAHFFHPEEMDPAQDGAGGVPVRSEEDFRLLFRESRRGNHPLLRCYSGTRDILKLGQLLVDTINNAWSAVPLSWYGVLDGRGRRSLEEGISEAHQVMRWHGANGVPVEVNEAHQWSLRRAPDVVAVAASYIAAYNARWAGVRDYVAQFMFNTPPETSAPMDLGKMLAKLDLIAQLESDDFRVWKMTRTGLSSYPEQEDRARGQLASSVLIQMGIQPHIVHVVGYSEADHAATADDIIGSCLIAAQVIDNCLEGLPDMSLDPRLESRRREIRREAQVLLEGIRGLAAPGVSDPLVDVPTLVKAIRGGYLDAPDLAGNPAARGAVATAMIEGACQAVHPDTGRVLDEETRLSLIDEGQKASD